MGDTHDFPASTSYSAHGHGQRTSYLDSPSARTQNHPYIVSSFPTGTGDQQYQYHDRRHSRVSLADRPLPVPGTVSSGHRRSYSNSHLPGVFSPQTMSSPPVVTPQIPPLPKQTQLQMEYPDNNESVKTEEQIQDHVDYHRLSYPALRIANAATPDVASLTQRGESDAPAAAPAPPPLGASQLSHHLSVAYHSPSPTSNYDHITSLTNMTGNGIGMNGTGLMGNGNGNQLSPQTESIGYWAEGLSHGTHENPPTFVSEEPLTAKTGTVGTMDMMDMRMSSASMANLGMGLGGMRAMSIGDGLTEVSFANRGPNVDKLRKVYYRLFTHSSGAYPSKWRIHADDPSLAYFHHDHVQPPRRAGNYIDYLCYRESIHKSRVKLYVSVNGDSDNLRLVAPHESFGGAPKSRAQSPLGNTQLLSDSTLNGGLGGGQYHGSVSGHYNGNGSAVLSRAQSRGGAKMVRGGGAGGPMLEKSHGSTPEDPLLICVELEDNAPREKAREPIGAWRRIGRVVGRCFVCGPGGAEAVG